MASTKNPRAKCRLKRCRAVGGVDLEKTSGITSLKKKCRLENLPGKNKDARRGKESDFKQQHMMKQMIRYYYGLQENQFKNTYKRADRMQGATGENLLKLLESRLDNMVYRMGFACTRAEARQLINHGHILVNEQRVTIPSYQVKLHDVVEVKERSRSHLRVQAAIELAKQRAEFSWLEVDYGRCLASFKEEIEVENLPAMFKPNLVVELYSK